MPFNRMNGFGHTICACVIRKRLLVGEPRCGGSIMPPAEVQWGATLTWCGGAAQAVVDGAAKVVVGDRGHGEAALGARDRVGGAQGGEEVGCGLGQVAGGGEGEGPRDGAKADEGFIGFGCGRVEAEGGVRGIV